MAKFSDVPYFILKEFLDNQEAYGTVHTTGGLHKGYLRGGKTSIWAKGGIGFDVWLKGENRFYRLRLQKESGTPDENEFKFKLLTDNFRASELTEATMVANYIGSEIWFRKDGVLHDYIGNNPDWDNYINPNKLYIFFGNYFAGSVKIMYTGMKDFAIAALPENNRTDNIKEFLNIYFDYIHNEPYNLTKNVFTLSDPFEVDQDFLYYIDNMYNITLPENLDVDIKRGITASLPDLLKRKGTYTSLLIIWKSILKNTTNYLNVYEKWHRTWPPSGATLFKSYEDQLYINYPYYYTYHDNFTTPPTGTVPTSASWDVVPITDSIYKTLPPTGGAGVGYYYSSYTSGASGYPLSYDVDDNNVLSPHYKVQMDLSNEPLGYSYIMNQATASYLMDQWEDVRPASRFVHYEELLGPRTDFSGIYRELFPTTELGNCTSKCCQPIMGALPNCAVFLIQYNQISWAVNHNLNSPDIITQCYDIDLKYMEPQWIERIDDNNIVIHYAYAVAGYAFMSKAEFEHSQASALITWTFSHTVSGSALQEQYVMTQVDDTSYDRTFVPLTSYVPSQGNMVITYTSAESGYALAEAGEYVFIRVFANARWDIRHGLGYGAIQVKCYDGNDEEIYPKSIQIVDDNTAVALFETAVSGHAVVKAIGKSSAAMIALMARTTYIKLGSGTTASFDPIATNDIETVATNTHNYPVSIRSDDTYYYVECLIETFDEIDATEIGVFDNNDDIAFYTKMSELYKPEGVTLFIHYRVEKRAG